MAVLIKLGGAGDGGFCFGPESTACVVTEVLEALPAAVGRLGALPR